VTILSKGRRTAGELGHVLRQAPQAEGEQGQECGSGTECPQVPGPQPQQRGGNTRPDSSASAHPLRERGLRTDAAYTRAQFWADREAIGDLAARLAQLLEFQPNAFAFARDDTLFTRKQVARALTDAGYPVSPATLASAATRGGGPPFQHFGPRVLYRWRDAIKWAQSRLTPPILSTSERDADNKACAQREHPVTLALGGCLSEARPPRHDSERSTTPVASVPIRTKPT
jgi:hypothetical protein